MQRGQPLPSPGSSAGPGVLQGMVGALGTLLAQIQLAVNQQCCAVCQMENKNYAYIHTGT